MTVTGSKLTLDDFIKSWHHFLKPDQQINFINELKCSVCLEIYKDPTITNCHHIFCRTCLNSVFYKSDSCPLCRTKISKYHSATPELQTIVKKALGLGGNPEAIDALKTPEEKSQYEICKNKVQKHIMESVCFGGGWFCELSENLNESVIFRLRYQLELRGFALYNVVISEGKICIKVIRRGKENVAASDEKEIWDSNFTAQKVYEIGKEKLEARQKEILNSHLSTEEKYGKILMLTFESQ